MLSTINLAKIRQGVRYQVSGLEGQDPEYADKLYKMGFVEGTPVELASVKTKDPIVVRIRGSRIALRKNEAKQVLVKEV